MSCHDTTQVVQTTTMQHVGCSRIAEELHCEPIEVLQLVKLPAKLRLLPHSCLTHNLCRQNTLKSVMKETT